MERKYLVRVIVLVCIGFFLCVAQVLSAQSTGTLAGTVTDPSGAIVPGAKVDLAATQGGQTESTTANAQGVYEFHNLRSGTYTLTVDVSGFALFVKENVNVQSGQTQRLNIVVQIAGVQQEVEVSGEAPHVDLSAEGNTSSVSISEKALDALSDDPDELQADLLALAGPSVGPNGGQIYVDGFTVDNELPPKNAIREVRINQNPFSAEYDRLGYGRVEIITKPGSNKFHGRFSASGNDAAFDTRNRFVTGNPPYSSFLSLADVSGQLGPKASYFLNYQHRSINDNAVVNAVVLDPNLATVPFAQTLTAPDSLDVGGPRFDYALSANNFLNVSYQLTRRTQENLGVGEFDLPSQGYALHTLQNTVRINDTQMFGSRFVNQIRFQLEEQRYTETPVSSAPVVLVIGAFTGGGNDQGRTSYHHHHLEFNEVATYTVKKHTFGFGGRLRTVTEPYMSPGNFNGTFTFSSLSSYAAGTPKQFTITAGNPFTRIFSDDLGVYFLDDWRVHPKLTLSYGLRFETQNYIHDRADWAPRVAIAYGISRKNQAPKTVLRAGFGLFYDRFSQQLQLESESLNGIRQTEYLVTNPTFYPNVPSVAQLLASGAVTTVYNTQPNLHAPYTIQTAIGLERQVSSAVTISVSYLNSRGIHQLISNNINAPLPGTYNPAVANSGKRPLPAVGNIYQYQSAAIFKQSQLITNFNVRAARGLSFFGYYSYSRVNSDTGGAGSFPSNPYNISQDYGRAAFDIRSRGSVGGTLALKYGFVLSPLAVFKSGSPYNVSLAQDLIGSTVFNQRPSFATSSTPAANIVHSSIGDFNINPGPNDTPIPINYGSGPSNFVLNLRTSKTIPLGRMTSEHAVSSSVGDLGAGAGGPSGGFRAGTSNQSSGGGSLGNRGLGGGGSGDTATKLNRRYSLTVSAEARNLLNEVNLAPPVGKVTSPFFGKSNALAGGVYSFTGTNRRIDLQLTFAF